MSARRHLLFFFICILTLGIATSAAAAVSTFQVLVDSDNSAATGCTVAGMAGVDHVFTTEADITDTTGNVTRTYRQICSGSTLGPQIEIDHEPYSAGFVPASGAVTIETRLPFAAFGDGDLPDLHLGFTATRGDVTITAIQHPDGSPLMFPHRSRRRRAVRTGDGERVIVRDGVLSDWDGLSPFLDGLGGSGTPAMRLLTIYAFGNTTEDMLYFAVEANVSDAPYANDDSYDRTQGEGLSVNAAQGVLANDGDPNNLPLTATPVSPAAHGTVTLNPDGSFTYTPADAASMQADTFSYRATNGAKQSNVAQVTITVNEANQSPFDANDDAYPTDEDTPLNVATPGVLSNDTAPGDAPMAASLVTPPSHGTVNLNADGGFTYFPALNFFGTDTFVYSIGPGGASDTATVTLTVNPVNDTPVVKALTFDLPENSPNGTTVGTAKVTDVDTGDTHTWSIVSGNTNGAFAINASTGKITVANSAALNFETTPTFFLQVRATDDGTPPLHDNGTITINLTDVNDQPVAVADSYNTTEDTPLNVPAGSGVLVNDSDEDAGASLTAVLVANPTHGSVTLNPDGSFLYTPNADYNNNFSGADHFSYRANDGSLDSNVVQVTINIAPVNDPPSFTSGGDVTGTEDTAYSAAWATGISAGPADEAGQALVFNVTNVVDGSLFSVQPAISPAGLLTFTPATNVTGSTNVTVELQDDGGGADTSTPVTFQITINPVNDPPTFTSGGDVTVLEDSGAYSAAWATSISPGPGASEAGQTLTFVVTNNTNPSLFAAAPAVDSSGTLTFTPAADAYGSANITIELQDDGGGTNTSTPVTFAINITAVNDEPSFTSGGDVTVNEDSGAYSAAWATAIDPGANESSQTVNFVITNNTNSALFASGPAVDASGNLTFTPATNLNGTAAITIEMHDDGGTTDGGDDTSASVVFNINVTAVNDEPSFTSGGNVSVVEDSGAYSAAWATALSKGPADESSQTLTFNISNNTNPSLFSVAPAVSPAGVLSFTPAANAYGTATITIYLTDDGGTANGGDDTSPSITFDIEVRPQNDAPTFSNAGNVTVLEDSGAYSAAWASAIDPGPNEGTQTVTFVVTGNTNPALFAAAPAVSPTGVLTFTPATDANGSADITLHLADDGGTTDGGDDTSADVTFTIFVTAVNDEPTFTSGGNVTVVEDSGAYSAAWATAISKGPADESTQTLTFVVSGNTNPSLFAAAPAVDASGNLTFTPAANAFGTATITIYLTDNGGTANGGDDTSASVSFDITVNNQNDQPSFTSGGDVTVLEDSGAYSAAWATGINPGPNEGAQNVDFVVTGNTNPSLFAAAPSVSAAGVLSFTPATNANGSSTITVHIHDDGGTAFGGDDTGVDVTFTIFVTAVNDEPTFTSGGNVSVIEDSGAYSAAWATAISKGPADENTQTLTFVVSGNTNPSLFAVAPAVDASGNLTFTPATDAFGTATITIYLTDNGGTANGGDDTSASVNFDITVSNKNDEPSFTSGGDVTVLEDSGAYSAAWATGINPGANEGSQNVSFVVTGNTNPALFASAPAVSPAGVLSFQPTADANGSSLITLHIVDDGGTANGGDDTGVDVSFTIFVTAVNDEPTFTSGGNVSVVEDSGAYSAAWATAISKGPADENTQTLTFVVSGNTNPSLFSVAPAVSSTGVLTFTPAANAFGTATITVYLTDDGGTANGGDDTSASVNFDITITNKNDEPSFTSGGDVTVNEDSGAYSAAWATGINPGPGEGSQNVDFVVTGNTNPSLFSVAPAVDASGNLTFTPAADANGSSTITLHIHDDGGTADGGDDTGADVTFAINVTAVNDEPSFSVPATTSSDEDAGAQSVSSFASSISVGPADESSQTVSFNVSQTAIDPTLSFTVAPSIASNGTLTYTAAANAYGSATFDVYATDSGSNTAPNDNTSVTHSFTITINPINDAPSFNLATSVTADEDDGAIDTAVAAAISPGPNETGQTLTFNMVQTNLTGTLAFDVAPSIDSSTGHLTFTATANTNGSATYDVTLSDNGSNTPPNSNTSSVHVFTITINAINDAPSFTIASDPPFVLEGAGAQSVSSFATSISAGPSDESGQTLTFNLTPTGTTGTLAFDVAPALASNGTLTYTPTAGTNGTASFSVTLSDNGSNVAPNVNTSGAQTFTIAVERGPSVTSSNPAASATIPRSQDLTFNFDETVSVDSDAFAITCNGDPTLLPYTITTSTGSSIVVNPNSDLPAGTCTAVLDKDKVHDTDTYDPPDGLTINYSVTFSTNTPPVADDDADFARGNVTLTATGAESVLTGDTDADGHTLSVTLAGWPAPSVTVNGTNSVTTEQGGTIIFNTDGTFSYYPQAGDQNVTDHVQYTVSDGFGGTDIGELAITVGPRFIFVDDDNAGSGTGTQADPYKTLALKDASPYIAANETVIVKSGSYTTGTTLVSGEQLIGQGVSTNITATQGTRNFTILTAGAAPVINRTGGDAITLNTNNTVRGFTIQTTTSGRGVVGNAFGSLTFNESSIATNGGAALDLTNGAATISLTGTSSTGSSAQGVNLNTVTGTVALGSGTISTPTGVGFNVSGGTAAITYSGNITGSGSTAVTIATHTTNNITLSGTITGSANGGISVSGKTSGTVSFSGTQNLSTGGNAGVNLSGNTGGTIAFSGTGLAITTSTGAAFSATGGGTVSVTGTTNTITVTGAGSGLTLNGVTVASGNNVTFNSLTAAATTTTGVSLTSLGGSGTVAINGGTNSAVTGLSMTTMGTVGTSLNGVTFSGNTTGITGTNFGTLTVASTTLTNSANQFLNLNTGTINTGSTFTSISGTVNANAIPVSLTGVGGSFTVSGGTITKGGANNKVMLIAGGSATINWAGNLTQGQNDTLVNVTTTNTGTLTFSGTLSATAGTGLVFNDADGTYTFSGSTTLNGGSAGISISNGSAGSFGFGASTNVTGTATGIPFFFDTSTGSVTYSGNLTQTAANRVVSITGQSAGTITFQANTIACNTSCTGILLNNVDSNVNFNGTNTLAGAGVITINTGSAGTIAFSSNSSVTNPSGTNFSFDSSSASVTYNGTLTQTGAQRVVSINAQSAGTITFGGNISANTSSTGILLSNADGTTNFNATNALSGGDAGVDITTGSSGTINFSANTSISNPSGIAFSVADSNPVLDYNGTITQNGQRLISIANAAAAACGTQTFDGNLNANGASATGIFIDKCSSGTLSFNAATKSLTTQANQAVTITNNTGAAISFTGGGLVLNTTSGTAFGASGTGGSVTVTGSGNTITSLTGTGLSVSGGTAIGSNGLTFQSINVDGSDAAPTNAILLSSTGSSGGLTVTGTGSGTTGGILRDTSGDAVSLNNVAKISLSYMQITSNLGSGISGGTINGLAIDNCQFSANGDNAASDESGINITNLTGTARASTNPTKITNSTFNEDYEFEIQITNSSATLPDLYMSNNSITAAGVDVIGNLVNLLTTGTGSITVDVAGGSFTGAAPATATALHMDASGGAINATVTGGTYTNNNVAINTSVASGGDITFDINGITATGNRSHALNTFLNANTGSTGSVTGKYRNNIIGNNGVANSGSSVGNGIRVANEGAAPVTMLVDNNDVFQIQSFEGLIFDVGLVGTATAGQTTNATITNNSFTNILGNRAIEVNDNQSTPNTPAPTICVDMSANAFSGVAGQAGNGEEVRIRELNGTVNVHQKTPTAAADALELDDANGGNSVNQFSISGTPQFNQSTCPQP